MRKYLIPLVLVAAGVAVPSTAAAKGAAGLTISGAGVSREIVDRSMHDIVEQTRFYETLWEPSVNALADWTPRSELGPRLTLSWDMDHDGSAPGPDVPFVQVLYPFAPGGPLVHTAEGQQVYLEPVEGGWHRAERRLVRTLRELRLLPRSAQLAGWSAV